MDSVSVPKLSASTDLASIQNTNSNSSSSLSQERQLIIDQSLIKQPHRCIFDRFIDVFICGTDREGRTKLHRAVERADIGMIERLLKKQSIDINAEDNKGRNVLHAIFRQTDPNKELIQKLVESGADINATDNDNRTPIHYAALCTMVPSLIDLLVEQGADINAQDKDGKNAVRLIWRGSSKSTNTDLIYRMLANGADFLLEDPSGKCFVDDVREHIDYLVEYNKSPLKRNKVSTVHYNALLSILKEHQDKGLNRVTDTWASILKEMCSWPEEGFRRYADVAIVEANDSWLRHQIEWIIKNPQKIHESSSQAEALLRDVATEQYGGPYWGVVTLLLERGVRNCLNDSQRQEFHAHQNIGVSDSKPEDIQPKS